MPFVSVTRLRLRSIRFLPGFVFHTLGSLRQVKRAAGFRDGAVLSDRNLTFWTLTAWDDAGSMRAYMGAGAHQRAMPRLQHWCDEASLVHWDRPEPGLPSWPEADKRMRDTGRAARVRHPSARHATLSYQPPRLTGAGPIRPAR